MSDPSNNNPETLAQCTRCRAIVPGGTEGGWSLFQEVLALEYSDPAYGAVHFLTVDAHAPQHSEDHGPRSNAFHLLRLRMLLEYGGDPRIGQNPKWFQAQLDGNREAPYLQPPAERGGVTIADVHGAASAEEHAERVYRWARSVWEAWDVPEIAALVERLVDYVPPRLHVVISSRYLPAFPSLTRWRVKGQVLTITRANLAFTMAEIEALFREQYDYPLSPELAQALAAETEGLAIALQMVWQGLQSGAAPDLDAVLGRLPSSLEALFDYLAQEVLTRQPPAVQRSLPRRN